MDYEQALEWVHSLPRLAAHPGVENTRRLLEKLGSSRKEHAWTARVRPYSQ